MFIRIAIMNWYKDPSGHKEATDDLIDKNTEVGAKALAEIQTASTEWGKLNTKMNLFPKGSDRYEKFKAKRDLQHDRAENARIEYANQSGDQNYNSVKYGKTIINPSANQKNSDDLLSKITEIRLTEDGFLTINGIDGSGNDISYYGADQDWFSKQTQISGGCGPSAAANILDYMALTVPGFEKLYPGNINEF